MKKFFVGLFLLALSFTAVRPVLALNLGSSDLQKYAGPAAGFSGDGDLLGVIGGLINVALSLLGAILLVLMVYAGILWTTSQGNEKQTTKAKEIIRTAIIGMLIALTAYSISNFVVNTLEERGLAGGADGEGNGADIQGG